MSEELKQRSMSDKLLIDRKLLERLQERLDPHTDARDWGMVCDAFRAQLPSKGGWLSTAWLYEQKGYCPSPRRDYLGRIVFDRWYRPLGAMARYVTTTSLRGYRAHPCATTQRDQTTP